jgi:hypothetical protein
MRIETLRSEGLVSETGQSNRSRRAADHTIRVEPKPNRTNRGLKRNQIFATRQLLPWRLTRDDFSIEFAGRQITGLDDFNLALRRVNAGYTVDFVALRGGKPVKLEGTMGTAR